MSECCGASEKVWGIMGSPPELPHDVQQGVMLLTGKNENGNKKICLPSLPHLLRFPSFAFQRTGPSKRK